MNILKLLLFVLVGLPVLKAVIFKAVLLLCSMLLLWTFCINYGVSWTLGLCICFYVNLSVTLLSVVFYILHRSKERRFFNVGSWLWTTSTTYVRIFCWLCMGIAPDTGITWCQIIGWMNDKLMKGRTLHEGGNIVNSIDFYINYWMN